MQDKKTLEKEIENYLGVKATKEGWLSLKFESPGNRGVPDRIVVAEKGIIVFVELKRPEGGVLGKLQNYQRYRLEKRGCNCATIKNRQEVDELIESIKEAVRNAV